MSATDNLVVARAWLRAFNEHDVAALVALYDANATHTSPKIRALHPDTGGCITGSDALSAWWRDAMTRLPGLSYQAVTFTADATRVFVEYVRYAPGEPSMPVAEVFDVHHGLIVASRVYHG